MLDASKKLNLMESSTREDVQVEADVPSEVESTIEVPEHGSVHKMRIIKELNLTPNNLPLDIRLRRVQMKQGSMNIADALYGHENDEVGLFDDIGICIVHNRVPQWFIGRIQRIYEKLDNGSGVEYQ